jgi:hypothetical protein
MGRIRENLKIKGRDCWTLFDSGVRNSYVVQQATDGLLVAPLEEPRSFALGGKAHSITASCLVQARVEGHPVEFHANVTDEIGKDEDGKPIEMLFGAIAMQQWGIKLDLTNERLDLTHLAHDFVEF